MTLFFGEDYIIQSTDVVLTPSGGQFGPDATGFSYEEFFGVGGDTPVGGDFSLGGSITLNIPFVGPTDILTARLFGNVGATFGLNISASLDPGSVDATLPYEVVVAFPDLEPTQGGEIVDIFFGTTLDPTAEGAGFTTQFPSFTFGIDLVAELSARLAAELGALGANTSFEIFDFTAGTVIPIVSVDTNRELANGDANPIELFGVDTPTLVDEIPGLDPAFNDAGEFAGIGVPLNTFVSSPEAEAEPKTDVEKEGDEQPDEEEPDLSGIDLGRIEVFVPNINTASSFADGVFVTDPTRKAVYNDDGSIDVVDDLDADGNNLGEGNRDDLAKLTLDLDGIVTYATGGAFPPLEFGASVGGSFGPAFFDAGFSYNLFDVELISALPLEQEFTLTPKVQTQLQFFEANDDGTKGEEKEVEVNMQRKVLRFDETGTFRDETIEARLRELADANSTFAQDIDLFVDFNSGITGAFTGQTNSIGGRMIISRDGGRTFEELFTNAADPIASSTPALGENQNVDLVLDENTVLGYRLFIGSGSNEVQEDYVIEFDQSDTVYVEEIEQISQFITETPFLDDLQAINLIYDADDTFVEVVTKSVPVVTNRTGLEFDLSLLLRGLAAEASFSAGIDLGIFTIETGIGFEIGPLFEEEFPLLNLDIVDIFNGAFVLEDTKTSSFVLGDAAAAPDLGDAIEGSSGNDTLMGTEEADVIVSFEGDDTIIALGGNDIIAPGLGEGSIDGGAGSDLIDMSDYDGVTLTSPFSNGIDLEPVGTRVGIALLHNVGGEQNFIAPNGQLGDEVIYTSIERFRLTDRFDYLSLGGAALVGSNKDDLEVVETLDGDDVIELFDTKIDLVDAGAGDDTVRVISILNLGEAGAGDPTYEGRVTGGGGQDELRVRQDADLATGSISGLTFDGFENLTAEDSATFLGGDDNANAITAGNDLGATLMGRGGNDLLLGGIQDDTLIGGAGADEMRGGEGIDTADYSGAATSVFVDLDFGGEGRGFRGEAQGDVLTGVERVVGSDFNDILIGSDPANTLEGGSGADRLMAEAGGDALYGGEDDDLLSRGEVDLHLFGNVYDGGEGFDIAALEVRDSFVETGTTTGRARFTYKTGSTFSSSNSTTDRDVTVSTKWTVHNHIEVDLAEDGTGIVQYIEEDADANIQATRISGTATYSHATPRSVVDFFPPYRVVTTTYNNNITDIPLAQLDNDGISFTKSSSFSNTSGSGKITSQGNPPSSSDRKVAGTETLIDIEGVIASQGNDILNGNSQDNAFFGNGGVDLIRGGDGDDRLGFGEGQALADVFSFPGSSGVQAPGSDPRVFFNLVQRLVFLNPDGEESSDGRNDWTPVGKIQINAAGATQDIGSFLWGQGGIDTLDMRFDRGISFFPDSSGNFARVNLEIPLTNAPINNYTGETVFYGFAEWFNSAGVRQSFATTYGIENVIGSENNDQITGDRRDNVIEGLGGADVMDGAGGFDTASYALAEEAVTLNFRADGQSIVMDNARATISGRGDAVGDIATDFEAYVGSDHEDIAVIEGGALATDSNFFANVILPQIGQQAIAFNGASFDPANLGIGIDLDTGAGDDLVVLEGFGAHTADLGDGDDAATLRNIGNTIDAGAGNDTITVLDHEDLSLAGLDPAQRVTTIDGGEGEDTVIFTGGDYELLELTDNDAIVSERLDPTFTPENVEFDISPIGLFNVDLTQTPEFQAAQQTARDAMARYELTNVEFVEINGERIRIDNPDPLIDADKTLTLVEDAIDPYALGLNVSSIAISEGVTYEIVEVPQTALIEQADGTLVAVGQTLTAAQMAELIVVPEQNFDPGFDAFVYREVGAEAEDTLTKTLPEPARGVSLGITAHVEEIEETILPPVEPELEIALARFNPATGTSPAIAEVQYADGGTFSDMPGGSMTIEFLFRSAGDFDPNGPDFSFLSYAVSGSNNELTMFGTKEGRGLVLGFNGVGTDTGYRIDQLFDRELHRISVTYDTTANRIEMFVDGIEVFSNTTASLGSIANNGYIVWGQEQDSFAGTFDANQIVKGDLGDIRIWDGVRSEAEIADNAFSELADPASETDLAAYWQADPANEGVMVNAVGDTHLALVNQPEIVTAPEPEAPNVEVIPTIRMNTGTITNEYVRAAGFSDMPTGPMTIDFIFQSPEEFSESGGRQHLMSYAVSGSTNEFLLYADQAANGGRIGLILNSAQTITTDAPSSLLLDAEPHRLSVLFDPDGDTLEIYIDGVLAGSASVAMAPIAAGGSLIFGQEQDSVGGGFNPNESVAGDFGDIRVWNGLRTAEEIAATAFAPLADPASEAGLVANWQVDPENSITVPNLAGTAVMNQFATPARASVQFDLPPEPQTFSPPIEVETVTKVVDQQGDEVKITVDTVPTDGVVFYLTPDPAFLAVGITVPMEVQVLAGDELTPAQLEGLYFRADPEFSGDPGQFTYTIRDSVSFRDLAATLDEDQDNRTDGAANDGAASQTITFDVIGANDAPNVSRLLFPISPGGDLAGQVQVKDPEEDETIVELVEGPQFGTVTLNPDGSFSYQQNDTIDFQGAAFVEDSFKVQAVETGGVPGGASGLAAGGAPKASPVQTQIIRIINPDSQQDIVFDPTNTEVFFDDEGNPINLGGLGTNDRIIGHEGKDGLFGFGGHDTLIGLGDGDTLDGGDGEDTADYSASPDQVFVALGTFSAAGDAAGDILINIEHLTGSAFADLLQGDEESNILTGGDSGDYLLGLGGDDSLFGGEGNDALEGGAGADLLDGGAGEGDFFSALDATGPVVIDLLNPFNSSAAYAGDTLVNIEGILGSADHANVIITDNSGYQIAGGSQSDVIVGGGTVDIIVGLGGNDTIEGGGANDVIVGGLGDDVLVGGGGSDLFLFTDDGDDRVTDFDLAGSGPTAQDLLVFNGGPSSMAQLSVTDDVDGNAVISYGTDPLNPSSSITLEGLSETDLDLVPGVAPDWILFA